MYLPSIVSRDVHTLWQGTEEARANRAPCLSAYTPDKPGYVTVGECGPTINVPNKPQYHRILLKHQQRLQCVSEIARAGFDTLVPIGFEKTMQELIDEGDHPTTQHRQDATQNTVENFEAAEVVEEVVDLDDEIADDDESVYLDYDDDNSIDMGDRRIDDDDGFMAGEEYDANDLEDGEPEVNTWRPRRIQFETASSTTTVGSSLATPALLQSTATSSRVPSTKLPDDEDYEMTFDD